MVSAKSSSAFKMTTEPLGAFANGWSGHANPRVTRAVRSIVIIDLPRPGSPASKLILPRARRPCHNHRTCSGCTSLSRTMTGEQMAGADGAPWTSP